MTSCLLFKLVSPRSPSSCQMREQGRRGGESCDVERQCCCNGELHPSSPTAAAKPWVAHGSEVRSQQYTHTHTHVRSAGQPVVNPNTDVASRESYQKRPSTETQKRNSRNNTTTKNITLIRLARCALLQQAAHLCTLLVVSGESSPLWRDTSTLTATSACRSARSQF